MLSSLYLIIAIAVFIILFPLMTCLIFGPKAGQIVKRGMITFLLLTPVVFITTMLLLQMLSAEQVIMIFIPLCEGCLLASGLIFLIGHSKYFFPPN